MGWGRPGDFGIDVMQFNLHKTFTTPHGGGGPGCGPVGYKSILDPYAPVPVVTRDENGIFALDERSRPKTIGRLRSFHGNVGMMVRAYTYLREMGAKHLKEATEMAVLNANYLLACLRETWHAPFEGTCMHELIISDKNLKETQVTTMDIAKRLMDFGFHPPTVYFPLVVKGAMLIEPTERNPRPLSTSLLPALEAIRQEALDHPETVKTAPHCTRLRRLDETRAARKPVLRFTFSDKKST